MEVLKKYPELEKRFEFLCRVRRDEILREMVERDAEYEALRQMRAKTSMALREVLNISAGELFEVYSDAVYAQEAYELDAMYRQAFCDALAEMSKMGLI